MRNLGWPDRLWPIPASTGYRGQITIFSNISGNCDLTPFFTSTRTDKCLALCDLTATGFNADYKNSRSLSALKRSAVPYGNSRIITPTTFTYLPRKRVKSAEPRVSRTIPDLIIRATHYHHLHLLTERNGG